MTIQEVFDYAKEKYGTVPEYLWQKYPTYAVLRNPETNKWYAVVMSVTKDKLGLNGKEFVNVLNVKCDPIMIGSLRQQQGFLPAYHMNKSSWISILLESDTTEEQISNLIDFSYELTGQKKR